MLVIISDLHLTAEGSGRTINARAFRILRDEIRGLAYKASIRGDLEYRPVSRIDLVLLGDILDVIRSWPVGQDGESGVFPWSEQDDPRFAALVDDVTSRILQANADSMAALREMAAGFELPVSRGPGHVPGIDDTGRKAGVEVRIFYQVGNHDWFYHLKGPAFDAIRRKIIDAMGLAHKTEGSFPYESHELEDLDKSYIAHAVTACHGDKYDKHNYTADPVPPVEDWLAARDRSSIGDAIVVRLLNEFSRNIGHVGLSEACWKALLEVDKIRPDLLTPTYVAGVLARMATAAQASEVKKIWNNMAKKFLKEKRIKTLTTWPQRVGLRLALHITMVYPLRWLGDLARWLSDRSHRDRYHVHAPREPKYGCKEIRFVVFGHTHKDDIVPLDLQGTTAGTVPEDSPSPPEDLVEKIYFNTGTWRHTFSLARHHVYQQEFIGNNVMTFALFYFDGERRGSRYEMWTGALECPPDAATP